MFNLNLNMKQSQKSKMEYILPNYRPVFKVSQKGKKAGQAEYQNKPHPLDKPPTEIAKKAN